MRKKNKGAVRITSQDVERTSGNAQRRAEREQRAEQRQRRMVENSRPIKPKVPAPVVKPKVKEQLPLELHAVVYNGFLALEAITDMPSKDLKPYGFILFLYITRSSNHFARIVFSTESKSVLYKTPFAEIANPDFSTRSIISLTFICAVLRLAF